LDKVSDAKYPMKYTNSGIYNATLDPTNPKTYEILNSIFDEVYYFQAVTFILVMKQWQGMECKPNYSAIYERK
jgi:hypothetical protein